jgi:hypothetical protein
MEMWISNSPKTFKILNYYEFQISKTDFDYTDRRILRTVMKGASTVEKSIKNSSQETWME